MRLVEFQQSRRSKLAGSHPVKFFRSASWNEIKKTCTHVRASVGDKGWIPLAEIEKVTVHRVAVMQVHGMFEHAEVFTEYIEGI